MYYTAYGGMQRSKSGLDSQWTGVSSGVVI